MNVYRITARDQDGKVSERETEAASLHRAVEGTDEVYEIVKVERIHPSTEGGTWWILQRVESARRRGVISLYRPTFKDENGKTSDVLDVAILCCEVDNNPS
jgi:hypothetical protein